MYYIIYKITNNINDKFYIGKHQTVDINDDYMGSGKLISRAIKKRGKQNFHKEILFLFDNEKDMNSKEAELVTEDFCKDNSNYNLCPGGHGGFGYINRLGINGTIEGRSRGGTKSTMHKKGPIGILPESKKRAAIAKSVQTKKEIYGDTRTLMARTAAASKEAMIKRKKTYADRQHAQGINNSQHGTFWVTDGDKNIKLKADDVIPKNWYKGRVIKK